MFQKLLNNYFSNTLIECLKSWALLYYLEVKIIKKNNIINVYLKNKKYKSVYYKKVMDFKCDKAILYLCNLTETHKEFKKILKEFQRKEC